MKIPPNGTKVRVHTRYTIDWMNKYNRPIEGVVTDSNSWDPPGTLRLFPVSHHKGESVISIERICGVEVIEEQSDSTDNNRTLEMPSTGQTELQTFEVKGSKDNIYIVKAQGSRFSCNCVAGSFGRACKHVREVQSRLIQQT